MDKSIQKYCEDGITISKITGGYSVFTVATQHFVVKSLDFLTVETFENAILNFEKRQELEQQMFDAVYDEQKGKEVIKKLEDFCSPNSLGQEEYTTSELVKLLGDFDTFDDDDFDNIRCVHYFKEHNVYIMVEGYAGSSESHYYDSEFIEVKPTSITKQTFERI